MVASSLNTFLGAELQSGRHGVRCCLLGTRQRYNLRCAINTAAANSFASSMRADKGYSMPSASALLPCDAILSGGGSSVFVGTQSLFVFMIVVESQNTVILRTRTNWIRWDKKKRRLPNTQKGAHKGEQNVPYCAQSPLQRFLLLLDISRKC
jgi:hypothetical protein